MAILGLAAHVLLFLFPLLAQGLPYRRHARQASAALQQQNAFPQQQFPAFQGAAPPFPQHSAAQAFASKLAGPPTSPLEDQRQSHQPPQFVANNGPLIRTSDGQFVLAPIQPQPPPPLQQQQFNPFQGASQQFAHPQQHFPPPPAQSGGPNQQFPFGTFQSQQQQQQQFSIQSNANQPQQQQQPSPASSPSDSPQANNAPQELSSSSANNGSSLQVPPSSTPAPTPPPPPVDKSVDLDGDGALSLNEVQYAAFVHHGLSSSVVENLFNEVDHNKDAFLSALEFNDIRPSVLAKAENAALRYLQNVDLDHNGLLSLQEAQTYILREYGISNRDVERIWRLVVPSSSDEMDAVLFSKLRRRVRGMSIRLARQIMKGADRDQDGHIDLREAQMIAFEQEGIGPAEVIEMLASVDDNNDGQLNAPEFADFERIVRAKAVETSKKALKVVDTDGSGSLTMDEAKKIAFDHYGFDEATLEPFFAQADESEDGQLDAVEFAGFRSVIRGRAVKNAQTLLAELDDDGDGVVSEAEAEQRTHREDDMSPSETHGLFSVADQDRNGLLDKVELADFVRLVRLTSIKFVADHFRDYDSNRDKLVTIDELERLVKDRYKLDAAATRRFFDKVDVDRSGDLNPGEIVDFRHEVRRFAQDRVMQAELEEQNRREMAEIEQRLRHEAESRKPTESDNKKEEEGNRDEGGGRASPTTAEAMLEDTVAAKGTTPSMDSEEGKGDEEEEEDGTGAPQDGGGQKQKDEPKSNGEKDVVVEAGGGDGEQQVKEILGGQADGGGNGTSDGQGMGAAPATMASSSSTLAPTESSAISTAAIGANDKKDGGAVAAAHNETSSSGAGNSQNPMPTPTSSIAPSVEISSKNDAVEPIRTTTTAKKQRKRRRKTTTAAPTTTTTTTVAAPVEEEGSYEDDGEEQAAEEK